MHGGKRANRADWVAERFKAPVWRFGRGPLGAYRSTLKRRGSPGFSGPETFFIPARSRLVLPSSVAGIRVMFCERRATTSVAFRNPGTIADQSAELAQTRP